MKSGYYFLLKMTCCTFILVFGINAHGQSTDVSESQNRREAYLNQILEWLPPDRPGYGRVSYLDSTFMDWLDRTGELPPDFRQMPSIPHLPDPLMLDEGVAHTPITTPEQWEQKKAWMREQLQRYVTGTFPPSPDNMRINILSEEMDGQVLQRMVELTFGPGHQAKLTVELMIPPHESGEKLPVFMTQWNHRGWAHIAVRRGYIGCVYAGADTKDDTEDYSRIWAGEYDFTRLMRRAWGSYRAIDYLYTLPQVDQSKIALTGHSRNGKQSLMAAAFDERITAIIPSSGGTGAEVPWRYCAYRYDVEDIALLAPGQPAWLHPRLRFFVGREHKLPVDQNSFMALIAPRGLMLSTAIDEVASNPWGIEKAYISAKKVFKYLDADDHIALRYRRGKHGTTAEDIESYVDFFDYVFGRPSRMQQQEYSYVTPWKKWQRKSAEKIDPLTFPNQTLNSGFKSNSAEQWIVEREKILKNVKWMLGEKPPGVSNPGPKTIDGNVRGEEKFGSVVNRPAATSVMARQPISPYNGFGDYLYGYLYYPLEKETTKKKLPVVIYLHEYDYSKGFSSMAFHHSIGDYFEDLVRQGFAVLAFDMIGFGTRQEEGRHFYDRYPHWSKMGKMVEDVRGAVDALSNMDIIDHDKIYVTGYSIGGTVGLYATALDERIAGLATVCGFTPIRSGELRKLHLEELSDQHLLLPRLGFFKDHPERNPYDYEDLLAAIAPRPVLVIAPEYDQNADLEGVRTAVNNAWKIYGLYNAADRIDLSSPPLNNRFFQEMREEVYDWLRERN